MTNVYFSIALALLVTMVWASWQSGLAGWVGRIALALAALVATAAVVAFVQMGHEMHWRSEGPGILLVWIAIPLFSLVAVALWTLAIGSVVGWRSRRRAGNAAPSRARFPRAVGLAIVALAWLSVGVSWVGAKRDKPAHDADVAAVRFVDGIDTLYSIDRAGVLKIWSLRALPHDGRLNENPSAYRMTATLALPDASGVRDMQVDRGGHGLALTGEAGVTIVALDASFRNATAVNRIDDATAAVAAGQAGFAVVVPAGLRWMRPGVREPVATLDWPVPIVAVDASAANVVFADAEDRVNVAGPQAAPVALGSAPFHVAAIAFSGDARSVLAVQGDGHAVRFDVARPSSHPTQTAYGRIAGPLNDSELLVCAERAVQCVRIDASSGRSSAAFSGIVKRYDRVTSGPGAAVIASGGDLLVVNLERRGYQQGYAWIKDPRF